MPGLMGSLQVLPLADLVEFLSRRRVSGALTCERGTIRKTVFVVDGAAVGAASNDPREYLGQFLVNFGHATDAQLAQAVHAQGETKARLGQVLVAQGVVPAATVREVLAIKIRETLLDAFLWDAGIFRLEDLPPSDGDDLDARVELADVAREAEFRATAWEAFRAAFPSGAATLTIDAAKVPADVAPATVDGRLLTLAREGRTIDELAVALHLPDFHLYQRLFALRKRGIVEAAPLAAGGEVEAPELLERARAFLADGRAADAEAVARRILELAPGHEGARAALAEAERALTAQLEAELGGRPVAPRLVGSHGDLVRLAVPAADRYVLSRCDGLRTVPQLLQVLPLRSLEVLRIIHRYAEDGTLELLVAG